jgi:hypothetical protein
MLFSSLQRIVFLTLHIPRRGVAAEEYSFREYKKATRKCFVLEKLVREQIGYYPAKLTESYIQTLAARMEESAKKDMVIQQPNPIKS